MGTKHYVVWIGRKPGIYTDWKSTETQVKGFFGARFKSFTSSAQAELALKEGWKSYYKNPEKLEAYDNSIREQIISQNR